MDWLQIEHILMKSFIMKIFRSEHKLDSLTSTECRCIVYAGRRKMLRVYGIAFRPAKVTEFPRPSVHMSQYEPNERHHWENWAGWLSRRSHMHRRFWKFRDLRRSGSEALRKLKNWTILKITVNCFWKVRPTRFYAFLKICFDTSLKLNEQ